MLERLWFYFIFPGIPVVIGFWSLARMAKQRKEQTRLADGMTKLKFENPIPEIPVARDQLNRLQCLRPKC